MPLYTFGGGSGGGSLSNVIPATPSAGNTALFTLTNLVPQMTAATSGGATATASTSWPGTVPYGVFCNSRKGAPGWITNALQTGWISIQFSSAKTIYGYGIIGWSVDTWSNRTPKSWTFEGSNDGTTWTVLDTISNMTNGYWKQWEESYFPLSAPATYTYYRLNVSANNTDTYMGVSQIMLYGVGDPPVGGIVGTFMKTSAGSISRLDPVRMTI